MAAFCAVTVAPAAQAVTVEVTNDAGQPITLGGPVSIRNMQPAVTMTGTQAERYRFSVTGPNGTAVTAVSGCSNDGNPHSSSVDYVGNGTYTVALTSYSDASCTAPTGPPAMLPFAISASTPLGQPNGAVLTRKAGSVVPNTVVLPIDLNPGALSTEVFAARNVKPNADGSLPGAPEQFYPDSGTRTVGIRLDKGPGTYLVVARAIGFSGLTTPSVPTPWSAPATIRAYAPFDLQSFKWTDQRGPSYRYQATIRATGASGRVNVAIGKGKKGKYKSYGTVRIRKHRFSQRFRLRGTGTYRIRFKYKGNTTVAGGFEVRSFQVSRRLFFRSATISG